jgi:hypothetical protein
LDPTCLPLLLQAALTLVGNTTCAIAACRLALSNGWTLSQLNPFDKSEPTSADDTPAEPPAALVSIEGTAAAPNAAKLVALTLLASFGVKCEEATPRLHSAPTRPHTASPPITPHPLPSHARLVSSRLIPSPHLPSPPIPSHRYGELLLGPIPYLGGLEGTVAGALLLFGFPALTAYRFKQLEA